MLTKRGYENPLSCSECLHIVSEGNYRKVSKNSKAVVCLDCEKTEIDNARNNINRLLKELDFAVIRYKEVINKNA